MVSVIKGMLWKTLGPVKYLKLVSWVFFKAYKYNLLQYNPAYFTHYMVRKLIQPNSVILDIGGNLGYYSRIFATYGGTNCLVYAVEPIELYRKVFVSNTSKLLNIELLPFALGPEDGTIKMGNPSNLPFRHGLMRVLSDTDKVEMSYEVEVKNPSTYFENFPKIDYIKCDIEGFEVPVIPLMEKLIAKNKPVLQIETEGENKQIICSLLLGMQYEFYYAGRNKLIAYQDISKPLPGDLIAIPAERKKPLAAILP
jgi:FkbM family methyltransferase